ncbi:MAG TPA: PDZ domain-containing protein, partial [Gemmatimonadales bacterium]
LAAWPVALAAQQRTPPPPRPPREPRFFAYAFGDHHGRIGVLVKNDANPETDSIGARIDGVTPASPAAKAGLKVGDIITRFNGTSLAGLKAEDDEESGPGSKLVELARRLEPGDTVQVEYRRGGESKKATLVAEDLGAVRFEVPEPFRFEVPEPWRMPGMPRFDFEFGAPWGDLELVSLNPDLGEYFGAKEGVLVVKAPADSSLPLKGGDVILSIGGRKPTSPSHAMRILRSYEPGETVALDIMRKQKRVTLNWKVPERGGRRLRHGPEHEDQSEFRLQPLLGRTRMRSV